MFIKQQTIGTSVASVTVSDAFSSTYDNYKITLNGGTAAVAQAISLQLGASVTEYYQSLAYVTYATGAFTVLPVNNGAVFSYAMEGLTTNMVGNLDIMNPFLARITNIAGWYPGSVAGTVIGYHKLATSYTSFTLACSANMTGGTITVYGYRKE